MLIYVNTSVLQLDLALNPELIFPMLLLCWLKQLAVMYSW